jgi:hypothetical protein
LFVASSPSCAIIVTSEQSCGIQRWLRY